VVSRTSILTWERDFSQQKYLHSIIVTIVIVEQRTTDNEGSTTCHEKY